MTNDPTETIRRAMVAGINAVEGEREYLEDKYGKVWDTAELTADFKVISFLAPFVLVSHRANGQSGTLEFQHSPRFYFNYRRDDE